MKLLHSYIHYEYNYVYTSLINFILICVSMKDRSWLGVEAITTVIRSGRLRWYGHVMRKSDVDCVKKCMEYRVEGRRPVGRPIITWLESVEADMTEPEIDRENVHDRMKWRKDIMKRKSNPIGKWTINR